MLFSHPLDRFFFFFAFYDLTFAHKSAASSFVFFLLGAIHIHIVFSLDFSWRFGLLFFFVPWRYNMGSKWSVHGDFLKSASVTKAAGAR